MESEISNLDSQIQMQRESVEVKDAEMKKIREQIEQAKLRFSQETLQNNELLIRCLHILWFLDRTLSVC